MMLFFFWFVSFDVRWLRCSQALNNCMFRMPDTVSMYAFFSCVATMCWARRLQAIDEQKSRYIMGSSIVWPGLTWQPPRLGYQGHEWWQHFGALRWTPSPRKVFLRCGIWAWNTHQTLLRFQGPADLHMETDIFSRFVPVFIFINPRGNAFKSCAT